MHTRVVSFLAALIVCNGAAIGAAIGDAAAGPPDAAAGTAAADDAAAPTDGERAAALRASAEERMAAGDFDGAAAQLHGAWTLRPEASTAILAGECQVKLRDFPLAARFFADALGMLPEGATRTRAQALFDEVRAKVGGIELVVDEPGATVIAGSFVGVSPTGEVFVEPGRRTITVKKTGVGEVERIIEVGAGKTVPLDIHLRLALGPRNNPVLSRPDVQDPGPAGTWSMVPAYVAGGVAVAAIGAGIGARLAGDGKGARADELLAGLGGGAPCAAADPPDSCASIRRLRADHDALVNAGTGLLVGGALALAAGVAYGAIARRRNEAAVAVVPAGSLTGGGLLIQGSF